MQLRSKTTLWNKKRKFSGFSASTLLKLKTCSSMAKKKARENNYRFTTLTPKSFCIILKLTPKFYKSKLKKTRYTIWPRLKTDKKYWSNFMRWKITSRYRRSWRSASMIKLSKLLRKPDSQKISLQRLIKKPLIKSILFRNMKTRLQSTSRQLVI